MKIGKGVEMERVSKEALQKAIQKEAKQLEEYYHWLEQHMPPSFFEEVNPDNILLIAHALMRLDLQDFLSHIHLKGSAIALCLDSADADLRVLKHYRMCGIKNYQAFVSNKPPPFKGINTPLRIATIYFTSFEEKEPLIDELLPKDRQEKMFAQILARNPEVSESEFQRLIQGMNARFLRTAGHERLILALDMFFRAKSRDHCQYEVRYNEDWEEKKRPPPCRSSSPGAMFPSIIFSIK